jgi:hypothetical protein
MKRNGWLLTGAFFLLVAFGSLLTPFYAEVCEKNTYTGEKECAAHHVSASLFIYVGQILEAHAGAITGLATVVLAIITWRLVTLSREQSQTVRAQLRAYLFIKAPKVLVFNAHKECAHEMWIRNYGQTPAHDVVVVTNTDFFEADNVVFPKLKEPDQISKSSIAPSGEIIFTTTTDDPLTVDQLNSVASGKQAFFLWGEIRYTDSFECAQTTRFRLRFGKAQLSLASGVMTVCNDGNQAT